MPWRENKGVCQFKRNLNRFRASATLNTDFPQRFRAFRQLKKSVLIPSKIRWLCSVDKFQMIPPKPSLDPHYSWVIAPPAAPVITSSITLSTYSATRFQLILILVVFKYKNRISCINLSCGYLLPLQSATRVLFRRIPTSHRLEVGCERLIAIHRDGT